jgi:hypothetical protein
MEVCETQLLGPVSFLPGQGAILVKMAAILSSDSGSFGSRRKWGLAAFRPGCNYHRGNWVLGGRGRLDWASANGNAHQCGQRLASTVKVAAAIFTGLDLY